MVSWNSLKMLKTARHRKCDLICLRQRASFYMIFSDRQIINRIRLYSWFGVSSFHIKINYTVVSCLEKLLASVSLSLPASHSVNLDSQKFFENWIGVSYFKVILAWPRLFWRTEKYASRKNKCYIRFWMFQSKLKIKKRGIFVLSLHYSNSLEFKGCLWPFSNVILAKVFQ